MGFATVIRNTFLVTAFALSGDVSFCEQKKPQSTEPPEMLVTEQGFLAINTPMGWVRSGGPGLAYFIRKSDKTVSPPVWIYISSAPIGPDEEAKDATAYIQSDISDFKERFKAGTVTEEEPLALPKTNSHAPVYTFRSGEKHNAIEQVAYIAEVNRVLTLVLSAKETAAFEQSLLIFREFVKSYGGSIVEAPNSK